VGIALGAVHLWWDDGGIVVKLRKGIGVVATIVCGFLLVAGIDMPREAPITAAQDGKRLLTWLHSEETATAMAKAESRPLMVDFTAEWCGACKKMAKETFSDPRVMEKAGHFVAVKVDATDDEDPQIDAVKGKYKVVGLPTIVLYDSKGNERKRFNDFVGPEDFLTALEGIQ
jgi:thiol:disulfide interchange protein DsbD